jgi:lactate dehydrogenase-like 2-hydroxyacid dehydrogenase
MKHHVLCLRALLPVQMSVLESRYIVHRMDLASFDEAALQEVAEDVEAVVTSGAVGISDGLIERLPNLRVIASSGVGYETIDIRNCSRRGIQVSNTPGVLDDDVADAAIMLMLATRRKLIAADAYVRSGDWGRRGMMALTSSVWGRKLGILGLGRIGKAVAARASVFGVEIAYSARQAKPEMPYTFMGSALDLARWADILIVALAGGPDTRAIVDREVIEAIGPDGTLINISRGSVVDEAALILALRDGRIDSAGLDVFKDEPNPDPALTCLKNVTLYPHHSSGTRETRAAMGQLVIDNLAAFFDGKRLLTPVCTA